jgi:DNA transformation protein
MAANVEQPFKYTTKKGEVTVRKFYTAPEFLLDDAEQLLHWSRRAIDATAD